MPSRIWPDTREMISIQQSPVASDFAVMSGTLVFRGTRVPAQSLLDYLNDGFSLDEFLEFFPSVQRQDALSFLRIARDASHS